MDFQQLMAALLAMLHAQQGSSPVAQTGGGQPVAPPEAGFRFPVDPATVQWGSGVNVAGLVPVPGIPGLQASDPGLVAPVAPDPGAVMYGSGVNVASPAQLSGNPDAPADAIWEPPPDPYAPYPQRTLMHPSGQPAPTGRVPTFRPLPARGPRVPIRGGSYAPDTGFMDAALAFMRNQGRFRPPYRVG